MNLPVGSTVIEIDDLEIEKYLSCLFGAHVKLLSVEKLGEGFHNAGFLVTFEVDGGSRRIMMRIVRGDTGWGHDYPSDRCSVLLLQHRLARSAPPGTCPTSYDVAALMVDGSIRSIGDSTEFLHFLEEVPESAGEPYSKDLFNISERGKLTDADRLRVKLIADYLANLHSIKNPNPNLYMRHLRDLIGHGEMLMGVIDTYPNLDTLDFTSKREIENIEVEVVRWRNRIKYLSHRCSRIHGDMHPFGNVRFRNDNSILTLDRSREEFGEPADDITSMSINYIFFSVWRHGRLTHPFKELFKLFLERYLDKTGDYEIFKVMAPFYAFRGLVVAHPIYYPDLESDKRRKILKFIINVLNEERFEIDRLEDYLESPN
ncbi:aminoglycoside phosphotransferase family protein [Candidatus Bathyarchaeota archaeon]|nr:aminoglycoside phosphotransferase family protein [Candidatus Bathyarchaeota archaeon]